LEVLLCFFTAVSEQKEGHGLRENKKILNQIYLLKTLKFLALTEAKASID